MTKLIVRVMDGDWEAPEHGRMLGWQQVEAHVPGDGTLRAPPIQIPIDQHGAARYYSVHWVDVNVETRVTTPEPFVAVVKPGDIVTVAPNGPLIRVGPQAGGLPPITTRGPVVVHVLAGGLGMVGHV